MINSAKRIALVVAAAACVLLLVGFSASAQSQAYPTRVIRLIVPVVPGGGSDFIARTLAEKLSQALGESMIVENRPGGQTNVGTELVARSAPDGYTLLSGSLPTVVNVTLYKDLRFNIITDFIHVSLLATAPNILVVHPTLPAQSVKELIAYAKANPGRLTFGSSGVGSSNHLSGELFKIMAGIDMLHVPYKGGSQAVTEVLGGHISMYFGTTPSVISHVRSGKLRALGVTSIKRSMSAPDIPTISEAGLMGFDQTTWQGLFAPAGTPKPVIAKLSSETMHVLRLPDVEKRFVSQGVDVVASSPDVAFRLHHPSEGRNIPREERTMVKAKYGDKVQIHYTGTLDDGTIFDSSGGSGYIIFSPIELVIGQEGDLLPKFQETIIGLEPGQSVKVKIACEDAYGPRFEEMVYVAQRSEIYQKEELLGSWRYPNGKKIPDFNPKKGDRMEVSLTDGSYVPVILTEVLDTTITFDANHPLAGKDLTFDITLVNIL